MSVRGKAKAAYSLDVESGRYALVVDESVRTSTHENTFKGKEAMFKYLDWLFGEGKWSL